MSVLDAASVSRLATLKALRDALAEQIDAGGGTVAQCAAQLRAVLSEIAELEGGGAGAEGTVLSEFEQRLRAREAATKGRGKKSG